MTRVDFGIGKRLDNLPALRAAGFQATRRLLDVEKLSHDPANGQAVTRQICAPVTTGTGTRIADLRLESITPGKMTDDLRRLRQHGLIERIPRDLPLPGHRHRPHARAVPHPAARPVLAHRPGHPRRPGQQHARPSLAAATRAHTSALDDPRPASRPRRLTQPRPHPTIPACKHGT